MGWRSETYLEMQSRLTAQVADLETLALYNNQFEHFESDENLEFPYDFPNCFIAFAGPADQWQLQTDMSREANPYIFRIHVGISNYQDEYREGINQDQGIAHLDFIDNIINALDNWTACCKF